MAEGRDCANAQLTGADRGSHSSNCGQCLTRSAGVLSPGPEPSAPLLLGFSLARLDAVVWRRPMEAGALGVASRSLVRGLTVTILAGESLKARIATTSV